MYESDEEEDNDEDEDSCALRRHRRRILDPIREQSRIRQGEWLLPLKEDLASWLNKTLGETHFTADNFMDILDNGVVVCRLAKIISDASSASLSSSSSPSPSSSLSKIDASNQIPPFKFKWWKDARTASFFARDNAENFLKWCRKLGVNEAVMFESESLVLQRQPRTVVLCLLELGRVAAGCGIEPPGIVKLEREIDGKLRDEEMNVRRRRGRGSPSRRPLSISVPNTPCALDCPSLRKYSSTITPNADSATVGRRRSLSVPEQETKLHKKVLQITSSCCSKSHIQQVSDGKYIIGGRIVYIRLLNDRHVMVRVGGGWDTLEHFVARHDPCHIGKRPASVSSSSTLPRNGSHGLDAGSNNSIERSQSSRPSKSASSSSINARTILF